MQDRTDAGQDKCRTGRIQDRTYALLDECCTQTDVIQDRCMTAQMQDRTDAGHGR